MSLSLGRITAGLRVRDRSHDALRRRVLRLSSPFSIRRQLRRLAQARADPGKTVRFAVLGDCEPGRFRVTRALFGSPGAFQRLMAAIAEREPEFLLQLGDMVSRGTLRNYERLFETLAELDPAFPFLPVPGNHERRSPHLRSDSRLFRACFGKSNYAFDHGPARFVAVDTSDRRLTRLQLSWLDRVLRTPLRKLVFTHFPPRPLREWTSVLRVPMAAGFRKGAEAFVRLASAHRVDRVYVGHIHALASTRHGGVGYVLSGAGGSPLYPWPVGERRHHFLIVRAGPRGIREEVRYLDGSSKPLVPS
ncbi:MAG: metallophosphoesterase [Elusimicrobiota bacterium]